MTVPRMKSLLIGVSMPREVSSANHFGSIHEPLFDGEEGASVTCRRRTFSHRAKNDKRSEGDNLDPNIADRMCTTGALASDW